MKNLFSFIKNAEYNITNSHNVKLTETQKQKLVDFDKRYGEVIMKFRDEHNGKDILNFQEERDKFLEEYNAGRKYFPVLKFNKDKIHPTKMKEEFNQLLLEINELDFDCILIPYYKYFINFMIVVCEHLEKKYDGKYFTVTYPSEITEQDYQEALHIIKTYDYQTGVQDNRNRDAEYAKKKIEDAINELGYEWKVEIHDNMVPRMNVLPNQILRINKNAKFSDVDIDGLIAHEVKGHVGRRYYGLKTGLNLFNHGLPGRNILDEGLAVWNSLNLCETPKPNILFNIAFKCFVAYNAQRLNFYDLFELCKKTCPFLEDKKIVSGLLRNKRDEVDTSLLGGDFTDASYYVGYKMIKNMSKSRRDDILKYNIGPAQIKDLPKIKKFFKLNKFESLLK